jgi:hypothetical protein
MCTLPFLKSSKLVYPNGVLFQATVACYLLLDLCAALLASTAPSPLKHLFVPLMLTQSESLLYL